ncbi:MAG: AraC family transcriptional regulator [Vicinamibacteria bacterium]
MTHAAATPLDTVIHRGDGTMIGAFRCPPSHRNFRDTGPIENDIFVFPRTSVRIRHAGGPAFVADQTTATIYNCGQIYDRGMVSEEGDRSDWFAVPRWVAIEAVLVNGLEPGLRGPFSFASTAISNRMYLAQRQVFRRALAGVSARETDEGIYALLDDLVTSVASRHHQTNRVDSESLEMAAEIRALISSHPEEDWPLSRLAGALGVSEFRLCRAFRKATGGTIHRHLLDVRLRASLESLERPRTDLTTLAFDLGFSSHSHFSAAFVRSFNQTPSTCRTMLAARS